MRMDSEGILHFSFFFYVLMKGRIATISFGCLWINKFKKGGTHMKETKIYADEFCTTFASTTEMLEFLAERAKQSKWIRKPTRMLKLVPLEKEAETIEEACEKELEGIVEDTEKNTQLVLKVNKDFYPVRDCAIHTILKRAGINGTGLKKLEKATYAKVVNYCLQVAKGDALIKVADGKVSAVHGGDDHDYCVLDMQTIFNMTSDYLKAHFKGSTYLEGSGSFDHSIVSAMWTLGGNQELLDTYHQALEDHGIEDKSLAPALRLTTSDVAVSGVNLYPMMLSQTSNRVINLGSPIKLSHDRAIIGETGSGKTSLAKLFMEFYSPDKGHIYVDGAELQNFEVQEIRKAVVYVSQEDFLFTASVRENLKMGNEEISDEEMIEISRKMGVHQFVSKMERAYDSVLEERGKNLSKGQRQKLSLTRAILRHPKILILDEATSNMDSISEREILNYIKGIRDITLILISHRINVIADSDCIYVLQKGNIVARGTDKQLKEQCKLYRQLYGEEEK